MEKLIEKEWILNSNYMIYPDGRIYSKRSKKFLTPNRTSKGYHCQRLGNKTILVHRIVLLTFIGEPPIGKPHAAHLDGNRTNNNILNLQWTSVKENCAHKRIHGTQPLGVDIHNSKLSKEDVEYIRKHYVKRGRNFSNARTLAAKFNVSRFTISRAALGHTYKADQICKE